jgi:hypothetical protein
MNDPRIIMSTLGTRIDPRRARFEADIDSKPALAARE